VYKFRRIPLILSGAREDILELCPSERVKFESLGYAILTTSVMATVSMWFALNSAMGVNAFVAVPFAIIWGFMIMGIDRWLITSMPTESRRKFAVALPRLALALLLGALISTPIVLRVFQSEINAQVSAIKQQRYSTFLTEQQDSPVAKQVTSLRKQVSALQQVIDTQGAAPLDPTADPEVKSLTVQLNYWQGQKQNDYQQWQCQLYGGANCPAKGDGPLAQTMHSDYLNAVAKTNSIQQQITQRENELASTGVSEEKSRYDQAVIALPGVQQQLNTAQARQTALLAGYYAQDQATNGILIRLQALSQLSNGDFTVTVAHWLLFLLFLVFELLPVSVKLMLRPGIYEEAFKVKQAGELGHAKRVFRGQAASMPDLATVGGPNVSAAGGPSADWRSVWHQSSAPREPSGPGAEVGYAPTRTMMPGEVGASPDANQEVVAAGPGGGYPDHGSQYPDEQALGRLSQVGSGAYREASDMAVTRRDPIIAKSGELPRLDRHLRAMENERISADSGGDGVQLSWDDE
jgi:hypothetical protein